MPTVILRATSSQNYFIKLGTLPRLKYQLQTVQDKNIASRKEYNDRDLIINSSWTE